MTDQIDPMSGDPLTTRLADLRVAVPPFNKDLLERGARVRRPGHTRRSRRRFGLIATAAAVGLLLATVAASPSGIVDLTQQVLRDAGLAPGQVVSLSGSATRGTTKVVVSGGYADPVSTVVFAELDNSCKPALPPPNLPKGSRPAPLCAYWWGSGGPYLVDQFGQRYTVIGGEGIDVGPYPIFFQPLRGSAARDGASLSLHVPITTPAGPSELVAPLTGTLISTKAHDLAVPDAVVDRTKDVTYQIVGLAYSGPYLEVHTRLAGQLSNVITHPGGGSQWPGVFLVGSSGRYEIPIAATTGPFPDQRVQDETRIFTISSPGTYQIVVSNSNGSGPPGGAGDVVLARWTVVIH